MNKYRISRSLKLGKNGEHLKKNRIILWTYLLFTILNVIVQIDRQKRGEGKKERKKSSLDGKIEQTRVKEGRGT